MDGENEVYASEQDRLADLQNAEAATRRAKSEANVHRNRALRLGKSGMKDAFREAIKEEVEAQKKEQEIRSSDAPRDLSGTAPTLSDSAGNFAPNPEVANVGGIGVEASNTKAGTDEQATSAKEVDLSGATQGDGAGGEAGPVTIPDNWQALSWPQKRSLASKLTDKPISNGEDADKAIQAELTKRG